MTQDSAKIRKAAAGLMDRVIQDGMLLSEALGEPAIQSLAPEGRARAQRLATESLRALDRLDRVLKPFVKKSPPVEAQNILRIATYELCTGAAAHGVVNDAVAALSMSRKTGHLKGLGNAVLRKVAEAGPSEWNKHPVPALPKWLRKPLVQAYSNQIVQKMEGAHFKGAPLDLTVKSDAKGWAEKLGGKVTPTGSVRLEDAGQVSRLDGFDAGEWWVQDAAAALPALILDVQPGETVADLCCAPGGKTLQLAHAGAIVTAVDDSERRLLRVSQNLERTGLSATIVASDVRDVTGSFDAILLDAPCSATGTMRRHPDLPFAKDGSEFAGLIALQTRMLEHAITLLKPGGRMVFCTCSLLPDEGECQVEEIIKAFPEMSVDADALKRPGIDPAWITEEGGLRLRPDFWPNSGGMDGFYIAMLRKAG
ncbi:MAG: transcription antitermination factor NusB [Pseudomonadota bacterium]